MARGRRPEAPHLEGGRRDRLLREHDHDPYQMRGKLPEPTACPECGAMYRDGRWTWGAPPVDAHRALCPACRRVRDGYPGGEVRLGGGFLQDHREEIVRLAEHVAKREGGEHPLRRIMRIDDEDGEILVTITEGDLARAIGEAVHHAYQGELDYHYVEEERFLRVRWHR